MAYKPYFEKLQDPRWQKKRLEALSDFNFTCSLCGDSKSTLHVHHRGYIKGKDPWEYDLEQLAVLCKDCHEREHEADAFLQEVMSRTYLSREHYIGRRELAFFIAGLLGVVDVEPETEWDRALIEFGKKADREFVRQQTEGKAAT